MAKVARPEDAEFFSARPLTEAIILEKVRPVLFVRDGLVDKAALAEVEAQLKSVRKALVKPISAVGRIELLDDDTYDWCGTGWRIDDDLIITNRHVANIFAQRQGPVFRYRLNQMGKQVRAQIDFREEYKDVTSEEFGVAEILWIAENTDAAPDVAVLRVRKDPGLPPPLSLANKSVKAWSANWCNWLSREG